MLVIETAFLGDAIVSLALARELKRLDPSCSVSYLVRPDAVEIIRSSPDVDEVIAFDKRGAESGIAGVRAKAVELNAKSFNTLFLLHGSRRSQMLSSLLTIAQKVGFDSATHAGLTHAVPDSGWMTRYERAILPTRAIFESADVTSLPRLRCPTMPEITAFRNRYAHVVALAPGSVWKTKKWGDQKYVEVAKHLSADSIGIIIIGGDDARTTGQLIQSNCPSDAVLDLTGRATLVESGGAIASASILVANDSAPTHLAVAVGIPVLTIFGPTIPVFGFGPPQGAGQTIEINNLWCRPCATHGSNQCPIYTHECMENISVEMVLHRVMLMLKQNA